MRSSVLISSQSTYMRYCSTASMRAFIESSVSASSGALHTAKAAVLDWFCADVCK